MAFRNYTVSIFCILTFFITKGQDLSNGVLNTERSKKVLTQGWKFHLGNPNKDFYKVKTEKLDWDEVTVPHTLKLTSLTLDNLKDEKTQLVFQRNVGWYRRDVKIEKSNRKVYLEFEGAHQITDLWINGEHVGKHSIGGYTPFHFDITNFVKKGSVNEITLLVDNRRSDVIPPDPGPFDYVKFSGLYRDVFLVEKSPVHVTFNWESATSGVHITSPSIDPVNKNATINVKTAIKNETQKIKECSLVTRIIDKEGIVVLKLRDTQNILPSQEYQFNQIGSLEDNVHFWGIDNPYLYRVNSVLEIEGKPVDFIENKLGLRKFELDEKRGFLLNGKPIKLIGANRHQHYPYIGDAVPNSLHRKDILQFKEFGFNIIRTAHYPQDNALIDACDELGVLVYEEVPTWISISSNPEWWNNLEKAARAMIRNHRNHPSVVIWGGGLNHRGYVPRVHNIVKQEDPNRLTASQGARWTGWQSSGLTDINANMLYGPFIWDRSEPMFAMEGKHGPQAVAPFKRDILMTGLISWTAHAYHTFHPTHARANDKRDRTRSGMMTLFRYPRPSLDWYKTELLDTPFISIRDSWDTTTEEKGLTIYSNAEKIKLFINDKLAETLVPSTDTIYKGLSHPPFVVDNIKYEKGILRATGIYSDTLKIETTKRTPSAATQIKLFADVANRKIIADGNDIVMVYAKVVDKNEEVLVDTDTDVTFSIEKGDASIVGDSSNINANPMFTEYGVAPAMIRIGKTPGEIVVKATSKKLDSDKIRFNSTKFNEDILFTQSEPIYDFKKERVDMGAPDQLIQFGWNIWFGSDNKKSTYKSTVFENTEISIIAPSKEGVLRWLGEMNVIGKYAYAFGDGVIGFDNKGIDLEFKNLPKGNYKLEVWHHAPRTNSDLMDPNKEKLKKLKTYKLPYDTSLSISSSAMNNTVTTKVTEGKEMQWDLPGKSVITFKSDGNKSTINFKSLLGKGIWINAFELSEQK